MLFKRLVIFGLALFSTAAALPVSQTFCNRKEIHDYSDQEWVNFANAFITMLTPDSTGHSKLEVISRNHNIYSGYIHGTAQFLPWHRMALYDLEQELKKIDESVCIPYWDSPAEASYILDSSIFKKIGTPNGNNCVTDGFFKTLNYLYNPAYNSTNTEAGTRRNLSDPTNLNFCLSRSWNHFNLYSTGVLNATLLTANNNYTAFESLLEYAHGSVHANNAFVMATMFAPADPLFWIHHAFIDKVWSEFQVQFTAANTSQYSGMNPAAPGMTPVPVQLTDILSPYQKTVADVLNLDNLNYKYLPRNITAAVSKSTVHLDAVVVSNLTTTTSSFTSSSASQSYISTSNYPTTTSESSPTPTPEAHFVAPPLDLPLNWIKMNYHIAASDPIPEHVLQAINMFNNAEAQVATQTSVGSPIYATNAIYTPRVLASSSTGLIRVGAFLATLASVLFV